MPAQDVVELVDPAQHRVGKGLVGAVVEQAHRVKPVGGVLLDTSAKRSATCPAPTMRTLRLSPPLVLARRIPA